MEGKDKEVTLEISIECCIGNERQILLWPLATRQRRSQKGGVLELGTTGFL